MGYYDFLIKEIQKQSKGRRKDWEDWAKARQGALEGGMGSAGTLYSGMFQKGTGDIQKAMAEGVARGESQADLEIAKIKAQEQTERKQKSAARRQALLSGLGLLAGIGLSFIPGIGIVAGTALAGQSASKLQQALALGKMGMGVGSIAGRAWGGTQEALEGIPAEMVSGIGMLDDNKLLEMYQNIYDWSKGQNQPLQTVKLKHWRTYKNPYFYQR